ncbi:MAG: type II toxin-antitoxin system VapC family toxin [Desulfobacterium sp.]|nr:type II toxin-antitoxin system VapC family toxin [Desulfobacterium sp.]
MGIILDTSILISAERKSFDIDQFIRGREEEIFGLSVITISELLNGVYRADTKARKIKRSTFVENIIEFFPIYPFEVTAARIYAEIWAELSEKGTSMGAHDLIIGSSALSMGFSVATFNERDFKKIPGLEVEIP